jgi:Tol biopolymer transport system component
MSAIYMYDIAANEFTEILSGEYMIAAPSWSPSPPPGEELIAYESTENDPWGFWSDIYVINPNTLEKQMLFDTGMNERHPSWSPDGLSVMYSTDSMFVSELFVYQIPIEESAQITFDELPDDSPCWCWGW